MWVWLGAGVALVAVVATATPLWACTTWPPTIRIVARCMRYLKRRASVPLRCAPPLQLPTNLDDPERIRQGAGNYNAMCVTCHLSPDAAATEMSKGLYPAPPNLSKQPVAPAEAFWVIKHGIKASGMPAWGGSMDDEFIWNMSAFLQKLPTLDATAYKELVDSSEGHSHGGGETQGHHDDEKAEDHPALFEPGNNSMPHAHPPGVDDDHHGPTPSDTEVGLVSHGHPDGKVESHPAPHTPVADDGHAHPIDLLGAHAMNATAISFTLALALAVVSPQWRRRHSRTHITRCRGICGRRRPSHCRGRGRRSGAFQQGPV